MSQQRTLLLIRHAETDLAGTFCGHSDPPINERGSLQIEALLGELSSYNIDEVHSSDLRRARSTAEAVATSYAAPLRVTPKLREICFGDWDGSTWEEIERHDPAYAQRWIDAFPRLPAPNGEEFDEFEHRILSEFDDLFASARNVAIVTHAGAIRVILTRRCRLSDEQAWLQTKPYCSVFAYSGRGAAL